MFNDIIMTFEEGKVGFQAQKRAVLTVYRGFNFIRTRSNKPGFPLAMQK